LACDLGDELTVDRGRWPDAHRAARCLCRGLRRSWGIEDALREWNSSRLPTR